MGCTCVTISHRPALVAFHDLVLALDGEGGWSVHRGVNADEDGDDDALSGTQPLILSPIEALIASRTAALGLGCGGSSFLRPALLAECCIW